MPVYEGRCRSCATSVDYIRPVDKRKDTPPCPACGGVVEQAILTPPQSFVTGKFDAFKSTVDGSIIRTNRELQEHNRRNNVVSMADGFSEDKILSGDFGQKEHKLDPKELKADIAEAIHKVSAGYRPEIGAQDDD